TGGQQMGRGSEFDNITSDDHVVDTPGDTDNDHDGGEEPNPAYPLSDQSNEGDWVLNTEMSDEFELPLDEDKWLIQGRNNEYQSRFIGRAPSQFSVNNAYTESGKLKIVTKWEPDYDFRLKFNGDDHDVVNGEKIYFENITTAAVISKKQFRYGYMEIKCKSANAPITSSFWTTGKNTSEMDMFEMFGGHKTNDSWRKRLKFNIISWDPNNPNYFNKINGPVFTQNIQVGNNTAGDFHVYGFDWTADYIKVYYDGVLLPEYTILKSELTNNNTNPDKWVTDSDYWIWFDSETFPWLGIPKEEDLPAEYQIEYLRVWQKNKIQ
uniref:GH16 domain-containing protein n=1 Tax=Wenyingzhuangia fucanilytica TaxID=1790137 RepID=UPI003467EE61